MAASFTPIIGKSEPTQALLGLVKVLASSNSTVLITGESGTGKELVAQALHRQGRRKSGPFVPINCGAIPRDLLESELFGHRKGAFTGAVSDRIGRFEMANGGTLFLDEIGDLPLDMQVKLLRVLQDRSILPVGAARPVDIDVRVVAATHKDLAQAVVDGRFREDLYYRLNVLPCHTTPLRERTDDIADLLDFYAARHAQDGFEPIRFAPDLLAALRAYRWPGNVRELSNLVDRFTTLFPGQSVSLPAIPPSMLPPGMRALAAPAAAGPSATPFAPAPAQPAVTLPAATAPAAFDPAAGRDDSADDALFTLIGSSGEAPAFPLPPGRLDEGAREPSVAANAPAQAAEALSVEGSPYNVVEEIVCLAQGIVTLPPEGVPLKQQLVRIERSLIEQALARTNGNVSQTARLLQLQRTTLIEKIQKYELRAG
ncbi:sigma-54 interaction domain-containing protein [Ramlibacter sp. MAHUQ-53]|uniref:sigma-54 interaction domain-containing protein n=1 Tax=unclassified Ramlibacter TaxID=2617605 RepID=UPI00363D14B1